MYLSKSMLDRLRYTYLLFMNMHATPVHFRPTTAQKKILLIPQTEATQRTTEKDQNDRQKYLTEVLSLDVNADNLSDISIAKCSQASIRWIKALRKIPFSSVIGWLGQSDFDRGPNSTLPVNSYTTDDIPNKTTGPSEARVTLHLDYCFRVIKSPNLYTFTDLKEHLEDTDSAWILEFLRNNGLEALFESLAKLSENKPHSVVDTFLQLRCVECVRAIMNSQAGLDAVIENKELLTKKFAQGNFSVISVYLHEAIPI